MTSASKQLTVAAIASVIALTFAFGAVAQQQLFLEIPQPPDDEDFIFDGGGQIGEEGEPSAFRFMDGTAYLVYQMDVSDLTLPARLQFNTMNQFLVRVSNTPPAETGDRDAYDDWTVIAEETEEDFGDNFQTITYEFTEEDLATGEFYLWVGDSFPDDGWGGQVRDGVRIFTETQIEPGGPVFLMIHPMNEGDEPYLYHDTGTTVAAADNPFEAHRFADAGNYFVYEMDISDLELPAHMVFDSANQFLIHASTSSDGHEDADGWMLLAEETEEIQDATNRTEIRYEFTEDDVAAGTFYVRVADSFPGDGWGGQVRGPLFIVNPQYYMGEEKAWFAPLSSAPDSDPAAGVIDPVWQEAAPIRLSDRMGEDVPESAEALSGQFQIGYHGDSIFLFFVIQDDEGYANPDDAPWDRDSVEIYMDLERRAGSLLVGSQVENWRTWGGPSQMRFQYDGASRGFGAAEGNMTDDDSEFATLRDGTTSYYEIELKAPEGLDLTQIESFGFLVQVNDVSDGVVVHPQIAWWGGPEQPVGEYNPMVERPHAQWATSVVWSEGGFIAPDPDTSYSGDGLTYQEKVDLGLDPWSDDTSGDGIPDVWILDWPTEYGLDASDPNVGNTVIDPETGLTLRQIHRAGGTSDPATWPDLEALPLATVWGLMVLALLLAGAAMTIVLRKRQTQ